MITTEQYKALVASRKFAADQLHATFPHLVRVSESSNSLVTAAKNIRIELKRVFPGIKFSVKTERFSMGNAIRIHWTDGPTPGQVEEISDWYEGGHFDGMTDCYEYRKDRSWPEAFGSAKYITHSRELSDDLIQKAIDHLWDKWHIKAEKITPADFRAGKGYQIMVARGKDTGRLNLRFTSSLANTIALRTPYRQIDQIVPQLMPWWAWVDGLKHLQKHTKYV